MKGNGNHKVKITQTLLKTLGPKDKLYRVYDTALHGFVLRVQPITGTMTFYFEYRNEAGANKSFKIGRLGNITLAQAREKAEQKSGEVLSGVDIQAVKKMGHAEAKTASLKTLSGFLESKYEPWATTKLRTGKDIIRRIKSNFSIFLSRNLLEISAWELEKWRGERTKSGIKPATINRDITCLYSVFSRAVEWEVIPSHPLVKFKPLKTDSSGSIRYLSKDEESRLIAALNLREGNIREKRTSANKWRSERNLHLYPEIKEGDFADYLKPMVLLALSTGLRRGELFNLKWEDIDSSTNTLTVQGVNAKNKTTRHINLNGMARRLLKTWAEQGGVSSGLVFHNKDGERFDNINTSWASLMKAANIKNFRWHDLRHDFASKLVMANVALNTVRELLGHSDLKMTLRYAHLAPDHKAEAVNKLIDLEEVQL
jgi:integrase